MNAESCGLSVDINLDQESNVSNVIDSSLSIDLDESWTAVDAQDLALENSTVSESMYLVLEDPSSLLHGEVIKCKAHALGSRDVDLTKATHGTLFLTNYRLMFIHFVSVEKGSDKDSSKDRVLELPLSSIASVKETRNQRDRSDMISILEVCCKNFRIIRFGFPYECASSDLYQQLMKHRQSDSIGFAFVTTPQSTLPDRSGWSVYDPVTEYQRLGFNPLETSSIWRLSWANNDFKLCDTYPKTFIVPAVITDNELRKISNYRAKGRIPAVTYIHCNGAVIGRCSQPLVGIRRTRCAVDEAYMAALLRANPNRESLYFIDCRSQTSAFANIALGAGFESTASYSHAQILFMGIENIHSMRDSFRRLFELIKTEVRGDETAHWLSHLESTRWLEHIRSLLVAASRCVNLIAVDGASIVIHCSDGWDRTAQLASLTKIMLDPYYRTLRGFQVLIEHEWISFGHRFADRSGYTNRSLNFWEDDECSPVFAQFIDAVWQLTQQFPCAFEFNSRYLVSLVDELYSSRSASFLFNSEKDRISAKVHLNCTSTWTVLNGIGRTTDFTNPFYVFPEPVSNRHDAPTPRVLDVAWHPSSLRIWSEFYLRCRFKSEYSEAQDRWAQEQRRVCVALSSAKSKLQTQLMKSREQLSAQTLDNERMRAELNRLKSERTLLQQVLEKQVFSDASRGVYLHEEEADDDDAVLLSLTHSVNPSGDGRQAHGSIAPSFEILSGYFGEYKGKKLQRKKVLSCKGKEK